MAQFDVKIDTEFIRKLNRLGERTGEIAQMMLDDAGQLVADELEAEIRSKHSASGELADSIDLNVHQSKDGVWMAWAFPEGRSKKLRRKGKVYARSKSGTKTRGKALYNADKLFWIEKGRSGQHARPFMDALIKNIEGKVVNHMQQIFEREVGAK